MKAPVPRVHAVTDANVAALPLDDIERRARALAHSAAVGLHARLPQADGRRLLDFARLLRRAADGSGAATLVNDRADVAVLAGAAGVHLPEAGLPVPAARRLVGDDALLGRSVHAADAVRRAADEGADYVFLGPIWATASHPAREGIGLASLRGLSPIRVIAIGGVTPARAPFCRDAGAWGVAAITALWMAPDPRAAVEEMLVSFMD
ncbi:MAG: thiamine phosphate synthase [Gemmatimonadetes bacterium]|nr:thiamine phosphate synthase [Gemmatimonadota bacterium]